MRAGYFFLYRMKRLFSLLFFFIYQDYISAIPTFANENPCSLHVSRRAKECPGFSEIAITINSGYI
jgi:hypothetical protein